MQDITLLDGWGELTEEEQREKTNEWQTRLEAEPQLDLHVEHHLCDGVYTRALHIPAGVGLVGRVHLCEQTNVVAKGRIRVTTDDDVQVLEAGQVVISKAGTKRSGVALEDTVWLTIHATDLTDPEEIERTVTVRDYKDLGDNDVLLRGSSNSSDNTLLSGRAETGSERSEERR